MAKPTGDRGTRTGGRTVGRGEVEIIAFTALQSLQSYKYAVTIASAFGCVHACVHACDVYVRMHKPRQCVQQLGMYCASKSGVRCGCYMYACMHLVQCTSRTQFTHSVFPLQPFQEGHTPTKDIWVGPNEVCCVYKCILMYVCAHVCVCVYVCVGRRASYPNQAETSTR